MNRHDFGSKAQLITTFVAGLLIAHTAGCALPGLVERAGTSTDAHTGAEAGATRESRRSKPATPAPSSLPGSGQVPIADQQIALDFTNAIVQLVEAGSLPLRIRSGESDPVLDALSSMLDNSGYEIDPVKRAAGERPVHHEAIQIDASDAEEFRHDVAVGKVELSRSYRITPAGLAQPVSGLYVRGAPVEGVQMLDAELFGDETDSKARPPARLSDKLLISYRHLLSETMVTDAVMLLPDPVDAVD